MSEAVKIFFIGLNPDGSHTYNGTAYRNGDEASVDPTTAEFLIQQKLAVDVTKTDIDIPKYKEQIKSDRVRRNAIINKAVKKKGGK